MNELLALRTLSEMLSWENDEEAREEFAWLRLISRYKYDAYQGYEPGVRFLESLIGWLSQFSSLEDVRAAYAFARNRLIYFSRDEIGHLVHRYYPTVCQILTHQIADENGITPYQACLQDNAEEVFDVLLRQSLFLGLSDGARMDVFRRANEGRISNEQVVVGAEITDKKWADMLEKLREDIEKKGWNAAPVFRNVFIIDDFTASGTSLIKRKQTGKWGGKIQRFVERAREQLGAGLEKPCKLHVHHYLASVKGKEAVEALIAEYQQEEHDFIIDSTFGYVIEKEWLVTAERDPEFFALLKRHYDSAIQTEHTEENIHLGYKSGALPIVLEHNTPNNSVALLWAESPSSSQSETKMQPLFRRRQRHL